MLYTAPALDDAERAVIAALYAMGGKLEREGRQINGWSGFLSRQVFERTPGNALALAVNIDGGNPVLEDADPQVWRALDDYRKALCHAAEPALRWSAESILALHSMMMEHDGGALPGAWRTGKVKVLNVYREVVYEAPDADQVPLLMAELVECLNRPDHLPIVIRAAMVHLNILRIHPFRDGNGRMARCLQAALLLRDRLMLAETANLEEYVGQHIRAYNDTLQTSGTCWNPNRDSRPWIRFCLTAHYRLAIGLLRKITRLERLSDELKAQRSPNLSDSAASDLGEIFGARPDVIGRWWRMRPDRVIQRLTDERFGYNLHDWPCAQGATQSPSRQLAALFSPASMDPAAPLPDPFKILDDSGLT